ncbi:MAG: tetratricopeptide repeat protein, partial [Gemmatimonadaceae bacterium]
LHESTPASGRGGEDVATFIGHALDRTRPLKWKDGWELLEPSQRQGAFRLASRESRRLSRAAGAGFFMDGSIIRTPDSVTVLLRLSSVAGDSAIRSVRQSGPASASLPQLGLEAVRDLLPDLVAPGGTIDLSQLSERPADAVANFLQGEREYRRMQFGAAFPHYQAAFRQDAAFSLAALRGAYAAMWLSDEQAAANAIAVALRPEADLTPAELLVTRGLRAYIAGAADSAITYLRRAIRVDSATHGAWTLLGEVYSRLPSKEWNADSLAHAALERARTLDQDFTPTLLLLEEMALRDGQVDRATTLGDELRAGGADTAHSLSRRLMHRCVRGGPQAVDWTTSVVQNSLEVLVAGKILGGASAQPECAIAAFRSLLASTTPILSIRSAALLGLQAQLAATNRSREAERAMELPGASGVPVRTMTLLAASTTDAFRDAAAAMADSAAAHYDLRPVAALWLLADFEARRNNRERVEAIAKVIRTKADSSRSANELRLATAVEARQHLLRGDSARALELLASIDPIVSRYDFGWLPAASRAAEQMLRARVLFARGEIEGARREASFVDATEPIANPFYLRESLTLRAQIATALGDGRLAEHYRQRLRRLGGL